MKHVDQTIDKKTFKVSFGQAITVFCSIVTITITAVGILNQRDENIQQVDSKIDRMEQSMNGKMEIFMIRQENIAKIDRNARKRDSAYFSIRTGELFEMSKENNELLKRLAFGRSAVSSN